MTQPPSGERGGTYTFRLAACRQRQLRSAATRNGCPPLPGQTCRRMGLKTPAGNATGRRSTATNDRDRNGDRSCPGAIRPCSPCCAPRCRVRCGGNPSSGATQHDARTAQAPAPRHRPIQRHAGSGIVRGDTTPRRSGRSPLAALTTGTPVIRTGVTHVVLTTGEHLRIERRVRRVDAGEVKPEIRKPRSNRAGCPPRSATTCRKSLPERMHPPCRKRQGTRGSTSSGCWFQPRMRSSGSGWPVFQRWLTETASSEIRDKLLGAAAGELGGKINKALDVASAGKELQDLSDEARKRMKELDDAKCAGTIERRGVASGGRKDPAADRAGAGDRLNETVRHRYGGRRGDRRAQPEYGDCERLRSTGRRTNWNN